MCAAWLPVTRTSRVRSPHGARSWAAPPPLQNGATLKINQVTQGQSTGRGSARVERLCASSAGRVVGRPQSVVGGEVCRSWGSSTRTRPHLPDQPNGTLRAARRERGSLLATTLKHQRCRFHGRNYIFRRETNLSTIVNQAPGARRRGCIALSEPGVGKQGKITRRLAP